MDQEPDLSREGPEGIRRQIDETRSSLTDKLETLEERVRGTVQGAKDTVHDTVAAVKRTFDVRYQVDRHPWAMFGGSFAVGFLLGNLVPPASRARSRPRAAAAYAAEAPIARPAEYEGNGARGEVAARGSERGGILATIADQFHDEINQAKAMLIGAAAGVLRDFIKRSLPPALSPQFERIMDSATAKLGGRPVEGPVVEPGHTPSEARRWS